MRDADRMTIPARHCYKDPVKWKERLASIVERISDMETELMAIEPCEATQRRELELERMIAKWRNDAGECVRTLEALGSTVPTWRA